MFLYKVFDNLVNKVCALIKYNFQMVSKASNNLFEEKGCYDNTRIGILSLSFYLFGHIIYGC